MEYTKTRRLLEQNDPVQHIKSPIFSAISKGDVLKMRQKHFLAKKQQTCVAFGKCSAMFQLDTISTSDSSSVLSGGCSAEELAWMPP